MGWPTGNGGHRVTPDERCQRLAARSRRPSPATRHRCASSSPPTSSPGRRRLPPPRASSSRSSWRTRTTRSPDIEVETGPVPRRRATGSAPSGSHRPPTPIWPTSKRARSSVRPSVGSRSGASRVAEFDGEQICAIRHYWNERELALGPRLAAGPLTGRLRRWVWRRTALTYPDPSELGHNAGRTRERRRSAA